MQTAHTTFKAKDYVVSVKHGDELVLLDIERQHYYSLRGCGDVLWALLCDGTTEDHAVEILTTRFGGSTDAVRLDTAKLLEALLERSLIEPSLS